MQKKACFLIALPICVVSLAAPVVFAKKKNNTGSAIEKLAEISPEQKILHVLNRLTFGPRPGDVDRVRALSVSKFIDQQLHPAEVVENLLLTAKLAPLETLRMSTEELVEKYPPQAKIRAMADGRAPYPNDLETLFMIQPAVNRYKAKREEGVGEQANQGHAEELEAAVARLTEPQQNIFTNGSPAEKLSLVEALPVKQQYQILAALPARKRQQLFAAGSPELRRRIERVGGAQVVVNQDLCAGKLYRAIYSNRQLEEVLTDFWYNHFNVFLNKGADKHLVTGYERDVIRPHVLGNFKDLLLATAQSPAMLFYLDNVQSVGPDTALPKNPNAKRPRRGLNENYARELMELHTLGVDGGYTQKDVTEVARCFTGWSIRNTRDSAEFHFNERSHDQGEKTVLGVVIPSNGGMADGLKVIDILAHHPATARFLSRSLAIRFVADEPPQALVDRMAATFTATQGDLQAVMKTMLDSPEFWTPATYRAKIKTPLEMVVSAIRATGADVEVPAALNQQLVSLGEPLYRKQEPTGYSNKSADWINSSALLARVNFALLLTNGKLAGTKVDLIQLPQNDPLAVAHMLLMAEISGDTQAIIQQGLAKNDNKTSPAALAAGLTLGSPDFQRR